MSQIETLAVVDDEQSSDSNAIQVVCSVTTSTYDIMENDSEIIVPTTEKTILSIYQTDTLGRIRVEFTDHTWGIVGMNNEWIIPSNDKEILWIHEVEENGYTRVSYTDKTQGFLKSDGTWLTGPDNEEICRVEEIEADGKRRVQFIDTSWGLLDQEGNWTTLCLIDIPSNFPKGAQLITSTNGFKYLLESDGNWKKLLPEDFIQQIQEVSRIQADGARLIQTKDRYNIFLHIDGSYTQIPDIRTEDGWRIPECSELKFRKRTINDYEFTGTYWIMRTNEYFYLGMRSNGEILDTFQSSKVRMVNKIEKDGKRILSLGYGDHKQLLNTDGSVYQSPDGEKDILDITLIPELNIRLLKFKNNTQIALHDSKGILKDPQGNTVIDIGPMELDERYVTQSKDHSYGLLDKNGKWIISNLSEIHKPFLNKWRTMYHYDQGLYIMRMDNTIMKSPNKKAIFGIGVYWKNKRNMDVIFVDNTRGILDIDENWIVDCNGKEIKTMSPERIDGHTIWKLSDDSFSILRSNGTWVDIPNGKTIIYIKTEKGKRAYVHFSDNTTGYYHIGTYDILNGRWELKE